MKKLRAIYGTNASYLADSEWIGDNTLPTLFQVRGSLRNSVKLNIGAGELAEMLSRLLLFAARDDNRPTLQYVSFEAKDGKLTLVSADGFRLAVVSLDYDDYQCP